MWLEGKPFGYITEQTGIPVSTVRRNLKKGASPKTHLLKEIAECFGKTLDELIHPDNIKEELCKPPKKVTTSIIQPSGIAPPEMEREHCLKEFDSLFRLILRWQEEENSLDSLTSMNFIREFHERFPELGEWLKKQKGGDHKDERSQGTIADGTDG